MVGKRGFGSLGDEGDSPDSKRRMVSFGQTMCPPRRLSSNQVADRFIPVRSAIDWELAQALLVGPARARLNSAPLTVYQKRIEKAMYNGRKGLLCYNNRLSATASTPPAAGVSWGDESTKYEKRQVHRTPVESRFCNDIVDDYGLNLLDWGGNNVVALAIGEAVHLWNYSNNSTSGLMELEDSGYVASVSWSPGASQIAIGLDENDVMLLDATTTRLRGIIYGTHHRSRIGSLAWNGFTLSTAGRKVINYDVRAKDQASQIVGQHQDEVYALKWSASGRHLASAGADGFVYVWDVRRSGKGEWQQRFKCHPDCAKALAWCPSESNMLAASGDESDRHIVFWNTHTGSPFCSVDTGSEVSEFLWSCDGREFVTSHGSPENQLTLWKYSSMVKLADLRGHELPVLFMSQSPDGSKVASVGAEEALLVWKDVFVKRASEKLVSEPFAAFGRIRFIKASRVVDVDMRIFVNA